MKISERILRFLCFSIIIIALWLTIFSIIMAICLQFPSLTPELVTGSLVAQVVTQHFQLEVADFKELVDAKILTPDELSLLQNNQPITREYIWHILLPIYGIFPYPASVYPELLLEPTRPESQVYTDARAAAVLCGFTTRTANPCEIMPLDEFQTLINKLDSYHYVLPTPDTTCPYLDNNQTWTIYTYQGRNGLLSAWEQIPASWRTDFINQSWQIEFTLPDTIHTKAGNISRTQASGMIDYAAQTIHLESAQAQTALHEFVHYAVYRINWPMSELTVCFEAEAAAVSDILGSYSQTYADEYFAEYVSHWLRYTPSQTQLQRLAPQTAQLTLELINSFPSLTSTP